MLSKITAAALLPTAVMLSISAQAFSYETMDTAAQLSKGNVRAAVYYINKTYMPVLQVEGQSTISVNVDDGSGGTATVEYLSYNRQTIECSSQSGDTVIRVAANPFEGLTWWAKLGSSNYTLDIPSVTVTNSVSGTRPGLIAGLGVRNQLFPDTIVTPGICVDFGLTLYSYEFDRFTTNAAGAGVNPVNNRFEVAETKLTFLVSKSDFRGSGIEPYGGISVFRYYTRIIDKDTRVHADGYTDNLDVFLGARIKLYPLEWLIAECNLAGSANLSLGFGWGH